YSQWGYRYPQWRYGRYGTSSYGTYPYRSYRTPYVSSYRPTSIYRPSATSSILSRIGRLANLSSRIGTVRRVRSGQRYPVFGGRVGGQSYRIITRPRGWHHEVMDLRSGELQQEVAR